MIALLNETEFSYLKTVLVFAGLVLFVIVAVILIEIDHHHRTKKTERQKTLGETLDEIESNSLIKIEEYRRDFDDAS